MTDRPVAEVAPDTSVTLTPPAAAVEPVEPVEADEADEPVRRRRRGRTALLIAGAAVLGVVAGTCTGYLIQADREPTRLPSLSQPTLAQAKGKAPEPLSAAQDRQLRVDGDLRKLLIQKPSGTKKADWLPDDGWMDLAEYAKSYTRPAAMFNNLIHDELRRVAVTGWETGANRTVEIHLVQYRQQESLEASDSSDNGEYWAEKTSGTDSWAIPGTGSGRAYVHTRPDTKAGYLPLYSAEAFAYRGDITMEIYVYDTKPIPKATIMDLAKRQTERL